MRKTAVDIDCHQLRLVSAIEIYNDSNQAQNSKKGLRRKNNKKKSKVKPNFSIYFYKKIPLFTIQTVPKQLT